jgi:hypothetical protein
MKLSEVLSIEAHNSGVIHLIKDGLFWRAYEISSYLLSSHIKAYQLTKKFYKNVGKEVI